VSVMGGAIENLAMFRGCFMEALAAFLPDGRPMAVQGDACDGALAMAAELLLRSRPRRAHHVRRVRSRTAASDGSGQGDQGIWKPPSAHGQMFAVEQIPATCLGLHVRRASRILTQIYDEALVPVGLALNQFSLLVAIQLLDSVAITQLAQELFMDQSTLSRNLKPLEREGWVAISPGRDRRRRLVTLTPSGQRLLEQAIPLWEQVQKNLLEHYGQQNWQALLTLLAETRCLRQSEA